MSAPSPISYKIRHTTRYDYGGRIDLCHSQIRLQPLDTPWQQRRSHKVTIDPKPELTSDLVDFFGNHSRIFAVQHIHAELSVTGDSLVAVSSAPRPWEAPFTDPNWREVALQLLAETGDGLRNVAAFRLPSPAIPALPELRAYADFSFLPATGLFEGTTHLMRRIFTDFAYVPGATEVHTPVATVLQGRKGVCQDFAHLMIGCLRSLGLAARYVSGYLETLPPPGKPKLQGVDASHAWLEVHLPAIGWIPFDPTNNLCPSQRHIVLAIGRDYFDVQPLRGIFVGVGSQKLRVAVDVNRVAS